MNFVMIERHRSVVEYAMKRASVCLQGRAEALPSNEAEPGMGEADL